ncbi:MAG: DUF5110 domain-containing protein [Bacteroidales bacterium]|nr:DUF5110 domain-containing protein [Candidatus Colimorpha onthohippi]
MFTSHLFRRLVVLTVIFSLFGTVAAQFDSKADPRAVVVSGNARFTVLTDRLIRMEYAPDGHFEDCATLAVVNRRMPVPTYSKQQRGGVLTITTRALTLTYRGGTFSPASLQAEFKMGSKKVVWHYGDADEGNLMGTTRTLDGCTGYSCISYRDNYLEPGVLSRNGWAVVDESRRHVLRPDSSDWGEWVEPRHTDATSRDLYLFAYGHDYKSALHDFTRICGSIPMPPKYTLGYWWSRYWIYTDNEMLELANEMRQRQIPIDVFIVDMDWHETWKPMTKLHGRDQFGQRRGWTGYTWNRDLFHNPEGFLHDLHSMHLKTALNLHPASGVQTYEDCYRSFTKDYLSRTSDYDGPNGYVYGNTPYHFVGQEDTTQCGSEGYTAPVPFRICQQAWADAYFNSVIHPLETQGVDFWWLDWQQWKYSKYVDSLSNTFWLNYTFFNDKVRRTKQQGLAAPRPFIYHRWGGLGSHRYQLGFSGDTYDDWAVLQFLPYFTATASNVGYGYWGHDIGGHMQHQDHPTNPELFTRWLQYGVFTPIFKTHSTQSAMLDRRIWSYPTHYEYMKAAIVLRYALSPYIYTASRQAYDSGISICRPLYYDYPEEQRAYSEREEFMFGDLILATAICQPADSLTGMARRDMWFPKGCDWYDMAKHTMYRGGTSQQLTYTIAENPWYVKAGSILPLAAEGTQNLQQRSNALRLLVVPGNGKATYALYEDDETTQAYTASAYAFTTFDKQRSGNKLTITIGARKGDFDGAFATRQIEVVVEGAATQPHKVVVDGTVTPTQCRLIDHAVVVPLPELSSTMPHTIEIVL